MSDNLGGMGGDKSDRGDNSLKGLSPCHSSPTGQNLSLEKIIDLIARESERAYRRGFQQGATFGSTMSEAALYNWRYNRKLTKAPDPISGRCIPGVETPRDRLECEARNIVSEVRALLEGKLAPA